MKAALLVLLMHLLIAGQGCALFDDCDDVEEICLVWVDVGLDTLITRDMYHIALIQGLSKWEEDLADPSWSPSEVRICGRGGLAMDFTITADDGSIVSAGRMRWRLWPGTRLLIALMRADHPPTPHGPMEFKTFPIVNAHYRVNEQDSIFVVWSSNSISDPVNY